ncbi:3-isopropylmalate dehydratase small subunit [Pacificispira sp.]|uniref:LeuD/DmdB family oxidoreductase small subunit n=1 Tax=Pacificispira sp. TaxID=2888761 RepID=UPI003B5155C2
MIGRVWKFGDGIDTDLLAPGAYMKGSVEELAKHCLESVEPNFAASVKPGDVVVAGRNFGIGSSREQAAQALKMLGVAAVVAESFGGIFYRNAFNLGLPALVCAQAGTIEAGQEIDIDPAAGRIVVQDDGRVLTCDAVPDHLMQIVALGGLVPYLEQRFRRAG